MIRTADGRRRKTKYDTMAKKREKKHIKNLVLTFLLSDPGLVPEDVPKGVDWLQNIWVDNTTVHTYIRTFLSSTARRYNFVHCCCIRPRRQL